MKTIICLLFVLTSISSYAQKVIQKTDETETSVHRINLVRVFPAYVYPNGDTLPSGDETKGYMYLIDAETKKKISANYLRIYPVTNKEFIATRKDDLGYTDSTFRYVTGVVNPDNEEVIPFIFDNLKVNVSPKNEIQYYGEINGRIVLVKNGSLVPTVFDASEIDWFRPFGTCIIFSNGKYGIAKDGKIFIPAVYDFILPHLGKAQIATYQSKNRMGYVSLTTGKELTPPIFDKDKAGQFSDEYDDATKNMIERKKVRIQINGKGGWMDNTGKVTMDK
jgi:hypothetical protein